MSQSAPASSPSLGTLRNVAGRHSRHAEQFVRTHAGLAGSARGEGAAAVLICCAGPCWAEQQSATALTAHMLLLCREAPARPRPRPGQGATGNPGQPRQATIRPYYQGQPTAHPVSRHAPLPHAAQPSSIGIRHKHPSTTGRRAAGSAARWAGTATMPPSLPPSRGRRPALHWVKYHRTPCHSSAIHPRSAPH